MSHSHEDRPLAFYWLALIAVLAGTGAELWAAAAAGSNLNFADAVHLGLDSLGIGLIIYIHARAKALSPETAQRLRLAGARISIVLLGIAIVWLPWEAIGHFATPYAVVGKSMVIGALFGLAANITQYVCIGSCACPTDRTGRLHAILDVLASSAVIAGALAVAATGDSRLDAFATLVIAMVMAALAVLTWLDLKEDETS